MCHGPEDDLGLEVMVTTCMRKPVFENTKAYAQREAIKRTQGPAEIKRVTSVWEIWVS